MERLDLQILKLLIPPQVNRQTCNNVLLSCNETCWRRCYLCSSYWSNIFWKRILINKTRFWYLYTSCHKLAHHKAPISYLHLLYNTKHQTIRLDFYKSCDRSLYQIHVCEGTGLTIFDSSGLTLFCLLFHYNLYHFVPYFDNHLHRVNKL